MVYQLEKKYFPDHCLDKAILDPGDSNVNLKAKVDGKVSKGAGKKDVTGKDADNKGLIFFEGTNEKVVESAKDVKMDVLEKKVEEFFRCFKKVPSKDSEVANGEPFIVTRTSELPPRWDSPGGTVVLVNKPKGNYS